MPLCVPQLFVHWTSIAPFFFLSWSLQLPLCVPQLFVRWTSIAACANVQMSSLLIFISNKYGLTTAYNRRTLQLLLSTNRLGAPETGLITSAEIVKMDFPAHCHLQLSMVPYNSITSDKHGSIPQHCNMEMLSTDRLGVPDTGLIT